MSFQYGKWIMHWESHGNREKHKEHSDVFKELGSAATVDAFVGIPIAYKKDNGAYYEEAHHNKICFKVSIFVLNIEHGNT